MAKSGKNPRRKRSPQFGSLEIINAIRGDDVERMNTNTFTPYGPSGIDSRAIAGIPTELNQLDEQVTRSYDLSVTAAGSLNIPVIGSVEGGFNRRVVVLERAAFKRLKEGDVECQYGYALRLCLTINDWKVGAKVNLPFLAASAELGQISAQWIFQIMGLTGPKIDSAVMPPTELNVEKFVLAKQSLEKVINAVRDPETSFQAVKIATISERDTTVQQLKLSVARAYALSSIERGWTLSDARTRLASDEQDVNDTLAEVYQHFAGLTDELSKPGNDVRKKAREVLGRIRAEG